MREGYISLSENASALLMTLSVHFLLFVTSQFPFHVSLYYSVMLI